MINAQQQTRIAIIASISVVLGAASVAHAAPITLNTALPVSDEEVIIREQIQYFRASDVLGGVPRDVKIWRAITAVGYGVTNKFAVFGVLPIVSMDVDIGGARSKVSGLADAEIFGRYQVYRKDGPGSTTRIAPFFGVRIPTGKTGETSDGSTDFFTGLIYTRASTNWNFDGQVRYVDNGRKNGFSRGDEANLDASIQYRVNGRNGNVNTSGYLFTVLEGSIVYADRNEQGGNIDPDTGGTTAFITPGLQYSTRRWIADMAVKIPVVKDLNGAALQPGATLITSIRVNF